MAYPNYGYNNYGYIPGYAPGYKILRRHYYG